MSAADLTGLVISALPAGYLLYALLRGERFYQSLSRSSCCFGGALAIVPLLGGTWPASSRYEARAPQELEGLRGAR